MAPDRSSQRLVALLLLAANLAACAPQTAVQEPPTPALPTFVQPATDQPVPGQPATAQPTAAQPTDIQEMPTATISPSAAVPGQTDGGCPTPAAGAEQAGDEPAEVQAASDQAYQPPAGASTVVTSTDPADVPNVATREAMLDGVNAGPPLLPTETLTEAPAGDLEAPPPASESGSAPDAQGQAPTPCP